MQFLADARSYFLERKPDKSIEVLESKKYKVLERKPDKSIEVYFRLDHS